MMPMPRRSWPSILRPVWTTSSLLLSCVSLSCWTVSAPLTPIPPEIWLSKPGSIAPVAPFAAARPVSSDPLMRVNLPPAYTVVLETASAVT
jgi:hypothetical protein